MASVTVPTGRETESETQVAAATLSTTAERGATRVTPTAAEAVTLPATPAALYAELCRVADACIAVLALSAAFFLVHRDVSMDQLERSFAPHINLANLLVIVLFTGANQELFFLFGLDRLTPHRRFGDETTRIMLAASVSTAVLILLSWLVRDRGVPTALAVATWFVTVGLATTARAAMRTIVAAGHPERRKRILIVGSGPRALELYEELRNSEDEPCEIVGFVDSRDDIPAAEVRDRLIGPLDRLEHILMQRVVDEVLIALPIKSQYAQIQRAIEHCERSGVEAKYLAEPFRYSLAGARVEHEAGRNVVSVKVAREDTRLLVKRLIDITGAAAGLIVLSPLLLGTALAIKLTSPGPVLFNQERYGRHKRRFTLYKFRTMVQNADALMASLESQNEATGPAFKIRNDPRITRVGRFLRRTSIDELPQLVNVLRGDMSLVGPRPMSVRDVGKFEEPYLMRRFSVTPGLTCLWQISGRASLPFEDWLRLDLEYIDNWSLALDLSILLRTIPAVLRGTGAT